MRRNPDAPTVRDPRTTALTPTRRSLGIERFLVRIVDPTGRPIGAVSCRNMTQCRDVIRVEGPVSEPFTMFFVSDAGRPVERWAVGASGVPKKGR